MFEKANPSHPDKLADRLAGAIVDLAYAAEENPRIAVEVLAGHGKVHVIIETSLSDDQLRVDDIDAAIARLFGNDIEGDVTIIPKDQHLSDNQRGAIRCGDNGIFKGCPVTVEQRVLTDLVGEIYHRHPYDGKYIIKEDANGENGLIVCQSHLTDGEQRDIEANIRDFYSTLYSINGGITINPLGQWTGGIDVDSGVTNRKLGSDMGYAVTGGGLHGKDLSKADVSVNIWCHLIAQSRGMNYRAVCAIGDEYVNGTPYREIVEIARDYIRNIGGFERFAEWGLIRPH